MVTYALLPCVCLFKMMTFPAADPPPPFFFSADTQTNPPQNRTSQDLEQQQDREQNSGLSES